MQGGTESTEGGCKEGKGEGKGDQQQGLRHLLLKNPQGCQPSGKIEQSCGLTKLHCQTTTSGRTCSRPLAVLAQPETSLLFRSQSAVRNGQATNPAHYYVGRTVFYTGAVIWLLCTAHHCTATAPKNRFQFDYESYLQVTCSQILAVGDINT